MRETTRRQHEYQYNVEIIIGFGYPGYQILVAKMSVNSKWLPSNPAPAPLSVFVFPPSKKNFATPLIWPTVHQHRRADHHHQRAEHHHRRETCFHPRRREVADSIHRKVHRCVEDFPKVALDFNDHNIPKSAKRSVRPDKQPNKKAT